VGEIIVKGPNVMKGYLNKSDLSNKYINNSWFRTDDFGSMDSDGYVQFFGRKKEIINIRGFMVAPIEVENVLMKYDGVKQAAVVGIKSNDKLSDKMIKAFIVIDNDNLSLDDLKTYSIENLEPYKVPESFEIINSIPVTSSGKIQRNLLENINRQ
jgi:long-chain acyl-CoA synthetase